MDRGYSREASSFQVSPEISCVLWNLKVFYVFHKIKTLDPVLIQVSAVHNFPSCLLKIHCNIFFPSIRRSSKWSLPFGLSYQNHVCIDFLSHTCHKTRPSHYFWFYHQNGIWRGAHNIL